MLMPLRTAYEQFRHEPGCCHNLSYDWYRQQAQREGVVTFGNRRQLVPADRPGVPAAKVKGQWMVNQGDVDAELAEHQASRAELEQITADYHNRILHGEPGSAIRTGFGSYTVHCDFHSIWRSDAKPWKDSGVYWFCSRCWQPAALAHYNPEYHTCSDWGNCGRDCTLSEVSCQACGTTLVI